MISDEERREVARRLRGQAKKLGPNMDAHEFAYYTADVIDVNECMTWHEMTLLLADLIEPTCDHEALLALADECDEMRGDGLPIGSHEVYRIARRIREALGVSDEPADR